MNIELKDWVRAARKHKEWTLAQLGEAVGRSKSNIGQWEAGAHDPSYPQVLQIAAQTGFPLPNEVELDQAGEIVGVRRPFGAETYIFGECRVEEGDRFVTALNSTGKLSLGKLSGIEIPSGIAYRMKGDGAHPVIKNDQFVIVSENRPPALGDLCVVTLETGGDRLFEFLFEGDDSWSFGSLTGKRVTIQKDEVEKVAAIMAIVARVLWRPAADFGL